MIDIKLIYDNKKKIVEKLKYRGFSLDAEKLLNLDQNRKILQKKTELLKYKKKKKSDFFNIKKIDLDKKNLNLLKKEINQIQFEITSQEKKLYLLKKNIQDYMLTIPNIPSDNVPKGINYNQNKIVSYWGEKKQIDFPIKDHVEIGKKKNEIDFASGVKLSGSRFVVIKGQIALMHRALGQFMMDIHTKNHGYQEIIVPYLVNQDSLKGTAHLPKFSNDLFHTYTLKKNKKYTLIPTAEVPLVNLMRNQIIIEKDLPSKMVAYSSCFRSEAGSYGKDTKGMIRMHQFDKVELVHFVQSELSKKSLQEIVEHAENILKLLNLHYRKILLCTGDMNFGSSETYDLEVWLPSQKEYREVSSCSNMTDFQSRRIKAFYKKNLKEKNKKLLHTLNGSGLALGRTLVAILENYQQSDGSIKVPKVLKSYMNNIDVIN